MAIRRPVGLFGGILGELQVGDKVPTDVLEYPINNITSTFNITNFNQVYSLQGTGSYTVTLPEATSANEGEVIYFYKEGNSNINQRITLTTSASQNILANRTTYQNLFFRFQGEAIVLISHATHWDVLSEANLFAANITANSETSFINGINKLNDLSVGGNVLLATEIALTASRSINLTGIKVSADSGTGTQIKFNNDTHQLNISGNGFYFDSVRFTGIRNDRGSGTSQRFMTIDSNTVNSGKFENCTFRDIVTSNTNTTFGNIGITRSSSGSGYNITFTDCDVFSGGSGSGDGLHFVIETSNNAFGFMNIFCFNQKRVDSNFNLFRMTGASIGNSNGNGITDGSVVFNTAPSDNRFSNLTISSDRGLIAYQTEKTTYSQDDETLIWDKTSNELRRVKGETLITGLEALFVQKAGDTMTGKLIAPEIDIDETLNVGDNSGDNEGRLSVLRRGVSNDFVRFYRIDGGGYEFGVYSAANNLALWGVRGPSNTAIDLAAWRANNGPTGTIFTNGSGISGPSNNGIEFDQDSTEARFYGDLFTFDIDMRVQGEIRHNGIAITNVFREENIDSDTTLNSVTTSDPLSVEYQILVKSTLGNKSLKLNVLYDGTDVFFTKYAELGADLSDLEFVVDSSAGDLRLRALVTSGEYTISGIFQKIM